MAVTTQNCTHSLKIVSFNMHGFNQGQPTISQLIIDIRPDILLLQEHWLTRANLTQFDRFSDYFTFGSSAMTSVVESGILRGRPFGGVITMVRNDLRNVTETIYCCERCNIIRVGDIIIVNIYFPCHGTVDRRVICCDLLADIVSW
jgi:exonuclease III